MSFSQEYKKISQVRYTRTLRALKQFAPVPQSVLDLGPRNPFSKIMEDNGYSVTNTPEGQDLDYHYETELIKNKEFDLVTSFEIFEHMVNPFGVLNNIRAKKLITTVPLNLWFAKAYWNKSDPFDRHYHEFESRQFDMLLDKSGWEIKHTEKWKSPTHEFGIRPIMRKFTPRYYLVVAERKIK